MNANNLEDLYELSPIQQGMLFHTLYAPTSEVYFEQSSFVLQGTLEVSAFRQAWQSVVARHSILRTAFHWEALEQPYQVVHRQVELPWQVLDWRSIDRATQQSQLQQLLQDDRTQGFDLTQAPLMRLILIHLAEHTYHLIWSHHHLILDGWSTSLLFRNVFAYYTALCQGQDVRFDSPRPYRDYIHWLQAQDLAKAEDFWRSLLKGFTAPTPLPLSRSENAASLPAASPPNRACRVQHLCLTATLTATLHHLTRQHQLTLSTLIQAAWAYLLSRYSGEKDVVFGVVSTGRSPSLVGVETMMGLFINTLPARVTIPSQEHALAWLKRIQAQQIERQQHEYSPLMDVQRWSEMSPGLPLFESIVMVQSYPIDASLQQPCPGLLITGAHGFSQTNYPLSLTARPGTELCLEISYDADRFSQSSIVQLLNHLQAVLTQLITKPDQPLSELSWLMADERQQILVAWNQTTADYPAQCLHQLFEAQVARSPAAIAAVFCSESFQPESFQPESFQPESFTYAELNARANQLAHHLQALGVQPETRVGLCVTRSLDLLVGILGILKAGGAYVPLDPAYPPARLAFLLKDAQVPILVTQTTQITALPPHTAHPVYLDQDWATIAAYPTDNPIAPISPDHLAYTLYTSGSTGQPKGVQIPHRAVVNFLTAMQQTPGLTAQDTLLSVTTLAFDIAALEIFLPLITGARLALVSREVAADGMQLRQQLTDSGATIMQATPATWRLLLQAGWQPSPLKTSPLKMLCGGEALDRALADALLQRGTELWNLYGPTEATIWSSVHPVTPSTGDTSSEVVSIGRPIANTQFYILDAEQQPVPVGVAGELYIGGLGLARGYLHRPDLTAEKFVPHPFSHQGGDRLYRTGDLARYLPNGEIEYLGRLDHQIKLRGFRIELGEIEATLARHPAVQQAIVILHTTIQDNQTEHKSEQQQPYQQEYKSEYKPECRQLVAYLVSAPSQAPTVMELRCFLQTQLPEYMIPSAFVVLDNLPLTPNGKIDRVSVAEQYRASLAKQYRHAPPSASVDRSAIDPAFVAPRTPIEQSLAEIWAQVLGVEQVGIQDNFFALGGDSMRSLQVRSQAQERGFTLSLQQLFQHPTIEQLAQMLTTDSAPNVADRSVPVQPTEDRFYGLAEADRSKLLPTLEAAYPLTLLQLGMLFHSAYTPDSSTFHNLASFHLRLPLNIEALRRAIEQLILNHPVLRTSFDLAQFSQPLQLVHQTVKDVPLQVTDLRHISVAKQEQTVKQWIESETRSSFDWTCPPLFRIHIHYRSETTFQFTLSFHHAILDGWSVALMLTELFQQYFVLLGQPSWEQVPSPPSFRASFRDFVQLQQESLHSEECRQYWWQKLSGYRPTSLPLHPSSPSTTSSLRIEVPIAQDTSDGLKHVAQIATVPLKSVLLAAHLHTLSWICQQSDVVTGISINGRPEGVDSDRSLGLFLNTLPFRFNVSGETWIDLIRKTFEAERELMPFRWYPAAQIQRDLGGKSLFETAFNFTQYHVYQSLYQFDALEILDSIHFEVIDLALLADFSFDIPSSQIHLCLKFNVAGIDSSFVQKVCDRYAHTLITIATAPSAPYSSWIDINTVPDANPTTALTTDSNTNPNTRIDASEQHVKQLRETQLKTLRQIKRKIN